MRPRNVLDLASLLGEKRDHHYHAAEQQRPWALPLHGW